ncbi:MAG: radical SAM protein, partial [Candidatus Diapherotrites archaeon]|nr:radical SAM protein [Candidatus Diapherotrites archaeon]
MTYNMARAINRVHIAITNKCNNDCIFCLNTKPDNPQHYPVEEIYKKIDAAAKEHVNRIIFSGGEPTTHPNIIDFVRYSKKYNFEIIQIISNGVKFSDYAFTKEIIEAGLTEITFSIHGHTAQLHDSLTNIPG